VSHKPATCPYCGDEPEADRRTFLRYAAASAGVLPLAGLATAKPEEKKTEEKKSSESLVKLLFESLNEKQKKVVCFAWDHKDPKRGLLRAHISNNWRITKPAIKSSFFTADQQKLIRDIFEGLVNPDWVTRFDKQFKDDMGGYGREQSIAIFGTPGSGKFEFVLSGRHGTMRCDGDSADHVAFAGPILYGHAASGYYEKETHPGNVFWHQALAANKVYQMLDGKPAQARPEGRGARRGRDRLPRSEGQV